MIVLELKLLALCLNGNLRNLFDNLGRLDHRQIFALFPRNGLIVFSVLLFGLKDALLDLLHLPIVGLLWFLSLEILLYRLDCVPAAYSSVLVQIFSLGVIRKLIL